MSSMMRWRSALKIHRRSSAARLVSTSSVRYSPSGTAQAPATGTVATTPPKGFVAPDIPGTNLVSSFKTDLAFKILDFAKLRSWMGLTSDNDRMGNAAMVRMCAEQQLASIRAGNHNLAPDEQVKKDTELFKSAVPDAENVKVGYHWFMPPTKADFLNDISDFGPSLLWDHKTVNKQAMDPFVRVPTWYGFTWKKEGHCYTPGTQINSAVTVEQMINNLGSCATVQNEAFPDIGEKESFYSYYTMVRNNKSDTEMQDCRTWFKSLPAGITDWHLGAHSRGCTGLPWKVAALQSQGCKVSAWAHSPPPSITVETAKKMPQMTATIKNAYRSNDFVAHSADPVSLVRGLFIADMETVAVSKAPLKPDKVTVKPTEAEGLYHLYRRCGDTDYILPAYRGGLIDAHGLDAHLVQFTGDFAPLTNTPPRAGDPFADMMMITNTDDKVA